MVAPDWSSPFSKMPIDQKTVFIEVLSPQQLSLSKLDN